MATGKKKSYLEQQKAEKEAAKLAEKARQLDSEAKSMADEELAIVDHTLKLEKDRLEIQKELVKEEALILDYAKKAAKAKADNLDTEADLYNTQMNLAKLSKKLLQDEKKLVDFKIDQKDNIDKIYKLQKKLNAENEKHKKFAEHLINPLKKITDHIRNIPGLGHILEPHLEGVENKVKDTFSKMFNKNTTKGLSDEFEKVKDTLKEAADKDGIKLESVIGDAGKASGDLSAGLGEAAAGAAEAEAGASGMGAALAASLGPIALIVAGVVAVGAAIYKGIKHINEVRDASIDIAREQGLAAEEAWDYQLAINRATRDATKYGGALAGMVKEITELNKQFNDSIQSNNQLTSTNMQIGAYMMKNMAASTEEAIKFENATALTGDRMDANVIMLQQTVDLINKSTNMGLRYKDVLKDIGNLTASQLANYRSNISVLVSNTAALKKYGLQWSDAQKSAEAILNIEQSIASEMEARVLTGKNINLNQARYLALQGDTVGALKDMVSQIGSYEEIEKMLPIQRKKLAEAIGLSDDQLLEMLKHQQVMSVLTGTQIKDVESLSKMSYDEVQTAVRGMDQASKEAILSERARIKASELTGAAMAKMSLMADAMIGKFGSSDQKSQLKEINYVPGKGIEDGDMSKDSGANGGGDLSMSLGEHGVSVKDTLIRPGMAPIKFDKDDIILGGTDLLGEKPSNITTTNNNSDLVLLLKELINKVDQPVYITMGGRVIDELDSKLTLRRNYNTKLDSGYNTFG